MNVPKKLLRETIAEILEERSNYIDIDAEEMALSEIKNVGVILDSSSERGWTAAGTRALADDIRIGAISIEDGLLALSQYERKDLITRIQNKMQATPEKGLNV